MKSRILILMILILSFSTQLWAGTFRNFNSKNGVADDTVTDVVSQSNAVTWVGTINGLSKFNGIDWIKYTKAAGCLPDDTVWSLDIEENTNEIILWVGTGGGLASYDGTTWRHYQGDHYDEKSGKLVKGNAPLAGNVINKVLVQRSPYNGREYLYLVNMGKLYKFDGQNWSTYSFGEKMKDANITTIAGFNNDKLYIGTDSAGLIEFNLENMKSVFYTEMEGLPSNFINCIYVDSDYDVWIGTNKGLAHMVNGNIKKFTSLNSKLPSNFITAVSKGFQNKIIVGTDRGIAIYSHEVWEVLPDALEKLNRSVVWNIKYLNPRGKSFTQTWFATRGSGVAVYQVSKDARVDLTENKSRLAKKAYIEKRYVDAINYYKELINLNPDDIDNYITIGNCYMELEDYKNTEHYLKLALKLNESSKPTLEKLGSIFIKMNNFEEAEKIYRKLISLYPTDVDGYLALGRLYKKNKKWKKAISNFKKALRINSDMQSIYNELSDSYMKEGNLNKALDIALQLQYKIPDNPENNVRIGRIYILQNRIDEAEKEINKVFLIDAANPVAKVVMARILQERDKFVESDKLLREALKANFKNGEAHALLAISLLHQNKNEDAQIELNYAKSFDDGNQILPYAEGIMAQSEGKYEEAIKYYMEAVGLGLNTANIYYKIGNCHKSLENYEQALQAFRNVITIDPNFRKAEDVKWIISKLETPTESNEDMNNDSSLIDDSNSNGDDTNTTDNSDIEELDF